MTNYEILQHLKYVKMTIDMLIDRIPLDDSAQKVSSDKQLVQPQKSDPSRNMGTKDGWTEMTGNQIEMPNIIM